MLLVSLLNALGQLDMKASEVLELRNRKLIAMIVTVEKEICSIFEARSICSNFRRLTDSWISKEDVLESERRKFHHRNCFERN